MDIKQFLKELRDSADIQYKIFTEGSCFRLYCMLKTIFPKAKPYWSDIDGHAITKINGKYYDIGGEISSSYVEEEGYYPIPNSQIPSYKLLKWIDKDTNLSVKIGKYKEENENN
jgi:hypothetical protein